MSRLAYRKDIDGLRALAILLVVLYHLGVTSISGGFIGVDLFFVISGFLIASVLDQQATLSPAVVTDFYVRRVKRLLPAFICVALATTAVAAAILLPEDFTAYLKSLRESFLFRANVFFDRATTGYFAADPGGFPWLHTWSLSIEWQFYAVFAPAVWALRWVLPTRATRTAAIVVAVLGALALSVAMTQADPAHAYFSMRARFVEFLIGASAAWVTMPAPGRRVALAISAACVAAIAIFAVTFTGESSFPGLNAAAVCAVAFVLLRVGGVASILAFDTAAFVGKRSYAAYLWHWPIVAFLASVQYRPSALETASLVLVIFVISDLTYRFVERPAIRARWKPPIAAALYVALPALVVSLAYPWVADHDGFPARLGPTAVRSYATLAGYEAFEGERCYGERGTTPACALGDPNGTAIAFLIGDSHAGHIGAFVDFLARDAHVRVATSTNNQCLALEGAALPKSFPKRAECDVAVARDFRMIRDRHFTFVLIAERWSGYPAAQIDRLDDTLATIVASGAIPVILRQAAEDGGNPRDCFFRHVKLRRETADDCTIAADNLFAADEKRHVVQVMDAMRLRYPTLRMIEPQAVQCAANRCITVIDGTPIYRDTHHLNGYGSTMLGRDYLARFGNPLAR